MKAMAVSGAHHLGSGGMDSRVDHEGRCIEQFTRASLDHDTFVAHTDQIRGLDLRESHSEGVYPERGWFDGVTNGDVASNTCWLVRTLINLMSGWPGLPSS